MAAPRSVSGIMRKILAAGMFCAVVFAAGVSSAQYRFDTGLDFLSVFPRGEFGDQVKNTGLGGSLSLGYRLPGQPFIIGADLGLFIYGREKRRIILSPAIPDLPLNVITSNNVFSMHLFLRRQTDWEPVAPFIDCIIGFNYLYTRTSISRTSQYSGLGATNLSDFALSYGFGSGFKIKVYENTVSRRSSDLVAVTVNVRARYLFGSEAEYLKKGSIERIHGVAYYDVHTSRTGMLLLSTGVSLLF